MLKIISQSVLVSMLIAPVFGAGVDFDRGVDLTDFIGSAVRHAPAIPLLPAVDIPAEKTDIGGGSKFIPAIEMPKIVKPCGSWYPLTRTGNKPVKADYKVFVHANVVNIFTGGMLYGIQNETKWSADSEAIRTVDVIPHPPTLGEPWEYVGDPEKNSEWVDKPKQARTSVKVSVTCGAECEYNGTLTAFVHVRSNGAVWAGYEHTGKLPSAAEIICAVGIPEDQFSAK